METQYKKVGNKLYVISKQPIEIVNLDMTGIEQIYVQLECIDKFKELNPDYADIFYPINFYLLAVQNPDYMEGEDVKPYDQMYLTVEMLKGGKLYYYASQADVAGKTISYSTDNGATWVDITSTTTQSSFGTFNTGDKILFKGTNDSYADNSTKANVITSPTATVNVYGNIMSLIYGDNFIGQTNFSSGSSYNFSELFNSSKIVDASNLILPATTLAEGCYDAMFSGCTSLTKAPELPATTLASSCYYSMFYGCTALTTAPELPATTLASSCYLMMFYDCTALTTAPELPATTLASYCYEYMFQKCSSLTTAPELSATRLASSCCEGMFSGCTSLTTAPSILPATTLASYCYSSMFGNCTSLTTAPELPATTLLKSNCYNYMFSGCTKLNYIKAMFTTTPSSTYTNNWVSGVSSTGTFVKNSAATWDVTGTSGIPQGWTVETASA